MMKKAWMLLWVFVVVVVFSGVSSAALSTIGTATYSSINYNLIYENDNNGQGLIWLDYTHGWSYWPSQVNWATGLNASGVLAYNLNPGLNVIWGGDWRLPSTVDGPFVWGYDGTTTGGYNIATSEMGHLYYVSLGNLGYYDTSGNEQPGYGLQNTGPFNNLLDTVYWSGTEYSLGDAWSFSFYGGAQGTDGVLDTYAGIGTALAVRSGEVSAVPVPTSVLLLGSGLLGLVGFRRKFRK